MANQIRTLYVTGAADPAGAERLAAESDRIDVTSSGPDRALELLADEAIDCVVSDYDLPGFEGLSFLDAVRADHPDLPFVLFTADGSEEVASEAIAAGVSEYVPRSDSPEQFDALATRIETSVDAYRERIDDERGPGGYTTVELIRDLYDVTTDTELSFEEKTDRILALGCERLDLPYGFLSRIDPEAENPTQRIVQARGDHELLQPGESCPLSEAYCRKTIKTDSFLAVSDALAEGWEDDPAYEVFELGSYIGGKVIVEEELYGTLCFASTEPRGVPFTDAEKTLIRLMSKWAGYELEHERVTSKLERQNERFDAFASVLAHDLRNPLNVAGGRLELAREEFESEHLDAIASAVDRMDSLIDDVLLLAREGKSVTDTEWVDLGALARESWDVVETPRATLYVETERSVEAEPGRLKQLFENLFRNAVEHAGTGVAITVGDLDDDSGFYVADDGPGIPAEDRDSVFEFGYSTDAEGTGYGLAIVRQVVDAHGWSISIAESDGGGARFEIRTAAE
ncbi:ATP-binding protein [Halobellus sp. EA9]|uniref:sensor histidine kinase n=1 Tax=Halobellus sp. EA9 TaxID=3421647 RepID=UPI003EBEE7B7